MKSLILNLKKLARFVLDTHLWNLSKARVIIDDYLEREESSQQSNKEHMLAALDWLKRAQDVTKNGGVTGLLPAEQRDLLWSSWIEIIRKS